MAERTRSSKAAGGLGKASLMQLAAELQRRRGEVGELAQHREALIAELEQIDAVLGAFGGTAAAPRGVRQGPTRSAKGRPAQAAGRVPGRRGSRSTRGQGWATIQAALKSAGGSGKTVDLKPAWAAHGSSTPLSVAMASFTKSGKLTRQGSGRETVYSLA